MSEEAKQLVEDNIRLAKYQAGKLASKYPMLKDEIYSHCLYGLFKASSKFDTSKNFKFSTYASRVMLNEVLSRLRIWNRLEAPKYFVSNTKVSDNEAEETNIIIAVADETVDQYKELEEQEYMDGIVKDFRDYTKRISERDSFVIKHYFGIDAERLTQVELSKELGVSQVHVSRIITKHKRGMREAFLIKWKSPETYEIQDAL